MILSSVRCTLAALVLVHSPICSVKHLVNGVSVVPLGQTDAQADLETLEVSCTVPVVELVLNPFNHILSANRSRIR